ncbi:ferritin [Gallalistipes aquisgranensis]|uniref:ferritin n=1 Tax=Gallalistipes aquisgranensis TaxID=2779358 RepID=UPI001CF8F53D|nr:ferritin [Gallalistipes aquisgranensis]MBE5033874.1 ferritin [Gallalistipes aquisgranensis]
MLNPNVEKALNAQINAELWSAYLYLSMSMDASAKGYKGVANWYYIQFQEEQDHARIFMNYVLSRGGRVELAPIAAVDTEWASPLASFEDTLAHERKVTAMIENLCRVAEAEKDLATSNMLVWFIDEQVEEEENAQDIIDQLKMVGDSKMGLYMIDKDLAARVYTTPSPLAGK